MVKTKAQMIADRRAAKAERVKLEAMATVSQVRNLDPCRLSPSFEERITDLEEKFDQLLKYVSSISEPLYFEKMKKDTWILKMDESPNV